MDQTPISWDQSTEDNFQKLLEKIPVFLRDFAREKVSKKAQILVEQDHRRVVTEKDMVDAFFAETPFGFHGPLKSDMESLGIDYTKYGHQK